MTPGKNEHKTNTLDNAPATMERITRGLSRLINRAVKPHGQAAQSGQSTAPGAVTRVTARAAALAIAITAAATGTKAARTVTCRHAAKCLALRTRAATAGPSARTTALTAKPLGRCGRVILRGKTQSGLHRIRLTARSGSAGSRARAT